MNFNDPDGLIAETVWDIANIGIGAYSLQDNIRKGNWGWAALDTLGLAYDGVATAIPFLPAGASAGFKAARAGNTIVNSAQIGLDVARTADIANNAARLADTTGNFANIGSQIHRQVGNALDAGNVLSDSANNFFWGSNKIFGKQPDLSWSNSGVWADLTTIGEWGKHVTKYTPDFGMGVPLLYERGLGLVDSTGSALNTLTTGAGLGSFGTQQVFDYFSGSGSANGGFVLYPNKPNTNMMQQVYSK